MPGRELDGSLDGRADKIGSTRRTPPLKRTRVVRLIPESIANVGSRSATEIGNGP